MNIVMSCPLHVCMPYIREHLDCACESSNSEDAVAK